MNISTAGVPKDGLQKGFVYIDDRIEDCIIDAKYWGTDNFIGGRIDGYERPLVVMTEEVAARCVNAAEILRKRGYLMKIYDAYRPQRAVDHFMRWASDIGDIRRKPVHYPWVNKKDLFDLGYVVARSTHSRGAAVDLTVVDAESYLELDMGAIFDFMDPRSHLVTSAISAAQEQNRLILREAMTNAGFVTYPYEWWHFHLAKEPYPDTYFDFPIR
jgi:D-alanyl-D-alanine dipeptidase